MHYSPGEHSQLIQANQGNHALHAVQGDLQYHAVHQYLGVRGYHWDPAQDDAAAGQRAHYEEQITVVHFSPTEHLFMNYSRHSQGNHQHQEIPSLQQVRGLQQHQPHQNDQQDRSHHVLLLLHLCQRVHWVRGVQQLPADKQRIEVILFSKDGGPHANILRRCGSGETYRGARGSNSASRSRETSSTLHTHITHER